MLGFLEIISEAGVATSEVRNYSLLGDISGDGKQDLLLEERSRFPVRVFGTGTLPLQDLSGALDLSAFPGGIVQDGALADLDGDLDNDLYLVRGPRNSDVVQAAPEVLEGHFSPKVSSERGVTFETSGNVNFDLSFTQTRWPLSQIHIGSNSISPTRYKFDLSEQNTAYHGIAAHSAGVDNGIYIGYEPAAGHWVFLVSMGVAVNKVNAFIITTTAIIDRFDAVGWNFDDLPNWDRYLVNTGTGFEELARTLGYCYADLGAQYRSG